MTFLVAEARARAGEQSMAGTLHKVMARALERLKRMSHRRAG
jgi:hypothetical protein